ncbi:MAG: dockerin type I repeat-containing protein [Ruminococcus sp.]|nr:dockerin type I repeat-containing protein [Ruminococcus sp.]
MQYLHNRCNSGLKFFSVMSAFVMSLCFAVPKTSMADYTDDISAQSEVSVYNEYLSWSQLDERWGNTPMGNTTIKSSGCLITSLAIMAMDSDSIDNTALTNMGITDIEQFNPEVLVNAYTNTNGFTSDGAIASWGTAHEIIPQIEWGGDRDFRSTEKSDVADEIRTLMNDGYYIIARVAMQNNGYHWVYIKNVSGDGNIIMCDPANQESDLYTVYPDGLQGEFWYLKGKKLPDINYKPENNIITLTEPVEYFVQNGESVTAYSEINGNSISATLTSGNVVKISAYCENYGLIESSDFTGWVDINLFSETESACQITGDINNNGSVDKYDLALLNTYLQQKELLADGVSTLSDSELSAADINFDGIIDSSDVIALIQLINN